MRPETFKTEKEEMEWADAKFQSCFHPLHPDRVFQNNWKLSERWFCHQKGLDKSSTTVVSDDMSRTSTDVNATMGAMALTGQQKPKRSLPEVHKSNVVKVKQIEVAKKFDKL